MEKAALFWSGGKDSAYALYCLKKQKKLNVEVLVTTLNEEYHRISMHGVSEKLLDIQARAVNIPLFKMWVSHNSENRSYERVLRQTLQQLKEDGFTTVVFGDIFLEDLRIYRQLLVNEAGLKAVFPLWKIDTKALIQQFLAAGFKTITCCISTKYLSKSFLGRDVDDDFLGELPPGVDRCGENGEFHTFCYEGPIFTDTIHLELGEERYSRLEVKAADHEEELGFWFVDLQTIEDGRGYS